MPQAIVGAALAGVSAVATGAALTAALVTAGTSLVLGGLSYALNKPKKPSINLTGLENKGTTVAVRQPDLTRVNIIGHTRIVRGFDHMWSTGVNGKLHIIVILCEGQLRAINEVILNDYSIPNDWIDSEGNVTSGRYAGKLVIRKHLGSPTQQADSLAVSNLAEWTPAHRLQGIAYLYMILTKDQDVYPTGVPNISAIVDGPTVFDPRTNTEEWTTNIALHSAAFLRNPDYGFSVSEQDVDYTNIAAQANICDEIVDVSNESSIQVISVNDSMNLLTLDGDVLQYQFGDRVRLSVAGGALPSPLSSGTDYYVIPYQVNGTPRISLATSLENSMNRISIDITTDGSGVISIIKNGEPRYHGSGVIDTETPLGDTLSNLVSCMAGRAICTGGFWTLLAGAWRTPSMSLGIDNIRGNGLGIKTGLSMSDSYNVIKGLFVSSTTFFQSSDYPAVKYQQFIDDDNGIEQVKELNLPYCNRASTAQRIAKIELFKGRQGIAYTADFDLNGALVKCGDNVNITVDALGWEEKPFEVTGFDFKNVDGAISTRLSLRETALEIFDWSSGEPVNFDPSPNTTLPNPFEVLVPGGVSFNSREVESLNGDSLFLIILNWQEHPDAFVTQHGQFEIQYKLSSETEWRPSFFVDGALTTTDVVTSSVNTLYDLRIRALNSLGVRSAWSYIYNAIVGSSGGVVDSFDWGFVNETPVDFEDWGMVNESPTNFTDYGYL